MPLHDKKEGTQSWGHKAGRKSKLTYDLAIYLVSRLVNFPAGQDHYNKLRRWDSVFFNTAADNYYPNMSVNYKTSSSGTSIIILLGTCSSSQNNTHFLSDRSIKS